MRGLLLTSLLAVSGAAARQCAAQVASSEFRVENMPYGQSDPDIAAFGNYLVAVFYNDHYPPPKVSERRVGRRWADLDAGGLPGGQPVLRGSGVVQVGVRG